MLSAATPSHQRVAWAWLEKLVSQPPPQAPTPPPALKMTARERERLLENAYESIKQELITAIKAEIPKAERAQGQIAGRHGIDPLFLDWFLVNGKHWPPMSPKQRRALRALQSTNIWFGALPDTWRNMVVPELDQTRDRDQALRELADWFVKNSLATIERKYVNAIWKHSRDLVRAFRGGGAATDPKASLLLMREFKKRLVHGND